MGCLKKAVSGVVVGVVLLGLAGYLAFEFTPWPKALLIRRAFTQGGLATAQALEKHVPGNLTTVRNEQYGAGDQATQLDVHFPTGTRGALPTVVWIHGGAFISGSKDEIANYLKVLASFGFTVIGVNYSLAPERKYPTPVAQVNDALEFVLQNADKYHVDPQRIVLAGDSAGSQLAAQLANMATHPDYARQVGLVPALKPEQLRGCVLHCGPYNAELVDYGGKGGAFFTTVLWSYNGRRDFLQDEAFRPFSVVNYLTPAFPPSLITAGNADFLEPHSRQLAEKLTALKVPHETIFFPKDHTPPLEHEYQFNLDTPAGQEALQKTVEFLHARFGPG